MKLESGSGTLMARKSLLSLHVVLAELLRKETRLSSQTIIASSSINSMALATQHSEAKIQCFECKKLWSHCTSL